MLLLHSFLGIFLLPLLRGEKQDKYERFFFFFFFIREPSRLKNNL